MPEDGRSFLGSSLTSSVPPASPQQPVGAGRLFRLAVGLALVATAGLLVHDRFFTAEARHAVLDGANVTLRSPIEGVLESLATVAPGTVLAEGAALGIVRNPRLDDARLRDLTRYRREAEAEAAMLERRLAQVRLELAAAVASASAFTAVRGDMLAARLREAESSLAAARARQVEALSALRRAESLAATGTAATITLDAARRAAEVAQAEARASADRRDVAATDHRAVLAGIFASDTANDRSASQIAQERLRLQEAELSAQRDSLLMRAAILATQIDEEAPRFARLREAVLETPTEARLIRRLAQPGEHVGPGQGLLLLADCSQPEVAAAVTARVFRQLRQGQLAVFHPAGGGEPRSGTIIALRVEPAAADGGGGRLEAVVALRPTAGGAGCESGRLGRLTFS